MDFPLKKIEREIEILGLNSIYYFEFSKDFTHPPEKHDFWEMVYVDSGTVNAVTDGHGRTLGQGQVIFHRPMELHAHVSDKKAPNNMLVVSFTTKSPAMEFFDKKVFTLGKTEKTLISLFIKEAASALGGISGEYSNKTPLDFKNAPFGSLQLLDCYLTEFLLVLKRVGEESGEVMKRSATTRERGESSTSELIVGYLKENVYENITLSDLCTKFYMGKSHLCELFSEYTGESPIEYFARLKMSEAKKLLLRDDLSVSKISDMLGYSSIHNFSRAFKNSVGVSPTVYKKRLNH